MEILGIIGPIEIMIILIAVLILGVIPIIALVDILRSEFSGNNKLIWVLVILFTGFIGAVLYYFLGIKQKLSSD